MTQKILKAGVIGYPIDHSKSPFIHRYWLEKYRISGLYERYSIPPETFEEGISSLLEEEGLVGFNVTIPHKQRIMEFCCALSPTAMRIGAVNMVSLTEAGLYGDNSDGFGFVQNVMDSVPDFRFEGKKALVLGAGGAARAIVDALIHQGSAGVIVVNRTEDRAFELARHFSCESAKWQARNDLVADVDFLVNTTSLGMKGQPPLEIDLGKAKPECVVADIVYAPLQTPLLQEAEARSLRCVTGIGMLLHQARPAFKRWFGVMPDVDDTLKARILAG